MFGISRRNVAAVVAGWALIAFTAATWAQDATPASAPAVAPAAAEANAPAAAPAAEAKAPAAEAKTPAAETKAPAGDAAKTEGKSVDQLFTDLIHYIQVGRTDMADSYVQAIVGSGTNPKDVYLAAQKTPDTLKILGRGAANSQIKPGIDKLLAMIEEGYRVNRADPNQIEDAIGMLDKGLRPYEVGAKRLEESGEFAVPQLIQKLRSKDTGDDLRNAIYTFLPRLGLAGVRPLSEVLQSPDPSLQEHVATALGAIHYPHAAAALKELMEKKGVSETVKVAAKAALLACYGEKGLTDSLSQICYELADKYYYQAESLRPDVRAATANVWFWKDDLGATYVAVPRDILCDVYAMRLAAGALAADPTNSKAVSLWLAANFKSQADLPAGEKDPTRLADQPSPEFYALASGPKYLQEVLARALKDKNTAVAAGAINALSRTAGTKLLVESTGASQPLVEALSYSDVQVKFAAAVTLANALPQKAFAGSDAVTTVLLDALRIGGKKHALLVSGKPELGNKIKSLIRAAGMDPVETNDAAAAVKSAHAAGGVDVAVLADVAGAADVAAKIRQDPALSGVTVIVLSRENADLTKLADTDKKVTVLAPDAQDDAIAQALTGAVKPAAAATSEPAAEGAKPAAEEAKSSSPAVGSSDYWAIAAAKAIGTLGLTNSSVIDVSLAVAPLSALLDNPQGDVRLAAANALAVLPQASAQQSLAKVALAEGDEKARITAFNLCTASVRRSGNMLTEQQAQAVLEIVMGKGAGALRDAAAELSGAMNLSSQKIQSLIVGSSAAQ